MYAWRRAVYTLSLLIVNKTDNNDEEGELELDEHRLH